MRLRFAEVKPPGNTTIFVLDPVPVPEQAKIAVALMDSSVLGGEQVGFVTLFPEEGPPGTEPAHERSRGIAASLRMMGGSSAVVCLPEITHVVVDANEWAPGEDVLFRLRSALGLEQDPCVGVMFCLRDRRVR